MERKRRFILEEKSDMKRRIKRLAALILGVMLCAAAAAGCEAKADEKSSQTAETKSDQQKDDKSLDTIVDGKDNIQVQGSMDGTTYVSKEGNITITLPDDSWNCESDTQDCITFSSEDGRMTILRMDGAEATSSSMFHSAEEYTAYLKGTTPNLEGEVVSFENLENGGQDAFMAVFHYTGENEFRYAVANGVNFTDHCYLINAMLRTEDENTLAAVRTSIQDCRITQ